MFRATVTDSDDSVMLREMLTDRIDACMILYMVVLSTDNQLMRY